MSKEHVAELHATGRVPATSQAFIFEQQRLGPAMDSDDLSNQAESEDRAA
jgi:hypothetical protein